MNTEHQSPSAQVQDLVTRAQDSDVGFAMQLVALLADLLFHDQELAQRARDAGRRVEALAWARFAMEYGIEGGPAVGVGGVAAPDDGDIAHARTILGDVHEWLDAAAAGAEIRRPLEGLITWALASERLHLRVIETT